MGAGANNLSDTLEFHLFAREDPLEAGVGELRKVLEAFTAAGELAPERTYVGEENEAFHADAVVRRVREHAGRPVPVTLGRVTDPRVMYALSFQGGHAAAGFRVWAVLPMAWLESGEHKAALLDLVRALAETVRPEYAFAHSRFDLSLATDPLPRDPAAPLNISEAYWLNLFGPALLERLGPGCVLTAPAAAVERLSYGGVMLLATPSPRDYASPEARAAQAGLLAHLRPEITREAALARLLERSAALAPVRRDWDPDIADLLELTLQDALPGELGPRIAALNAWRPPEVGESLSRPLPTDIEEHAAEAVRYDGWAEELVAVFHTRVPEVLDTAVESLPRLDYLFWHHDYAGQLDRAYVAKTLAPELGAYLGRVMRLHLGGRWVPRRKLEESQMVIGGRAWLPFLRARRHVQSRQAALDYSLTKFFRAAESAAARKQ